MEEMTRLFNLDFQLLHDTCLLYTSLIYIDNYEEALDSIEDVKRSLLIALVDRKVNKYFTEIDALVRKIEKEIGRAHV